MESMRIEQVSYFKEGIHRESTYEGTLTMGSVLLNFPGARDWWLTRREYFDAEFVEIFETWIKESEGRKLYPTREGK